MKPLTSDQIRGNWATLLTAWNADDSLDLGIFMFTIQQLQHGFLKRLHP